MEFHTKELFIIIIIMLLNSSEVLENRREMLNIFVKEVDSNCSLLEGYT